MEEPRFIEGSKIVEKENMPKTSEEEAMLIAAEKRLHMLEGLAKQFMDHFGYTPDQVEMVEAHEEADGRHKISWFFRRKVDHGVDMGGQDETAVSLWTPKGECKAVRTFKNDQ